MKMIPSLKHTVGFIYALDGTNYRPLGTGFFAWVREGDRVFNYLITCKHVVKDHVEIYPLFVRLNRQNDIGVIFVPLESKWIYHSDKAVDLAVTLFEPPQDIPVEFEAVETEELFLSDEWIRDFISEGDRIAFIGLLTKQTGTDRNTPVYRFGNIAMMPDGKLKGHYGAAEYLLVECMAFKGNSGSPLWVAIPDPIQENPYRQIVRILGVVTEVYLREEIESSVTNQILAYNSGLTFVVPIAYVRDILFGDELTSDRKRHI